MARERCECMQEKIEKIYSDASDAAKTYRRKRDATCHTVHEMNLLEAFSPVHQGIFILGKLVVLC